MKFDLGGTTYEFNGDRLSIGEARAIKRHLGVSLSQFDLDLKLWERGIGMPDADTIAGVVWVALRRAAGEDPDLAVIEQIDIGELGQSIVAHKGANAAGEAADAADEAAVPQPVSADSTP